MEKLIDLINGVIWSPALIYLCLGAGFFYSILTRFAQVRHFFEMWRLLLNPQKSPEGISSFQALAVSLSGRVGMGNIAGVAAAIGFGGPGAVFWMWVVAFLGASTAYVESTLGQLYKEESDGQYRGGPAYYFERCLGWKTFGIIFAIASIISCGLFLPGVQANGVANAITMIVGEGNMVQSSFGDIGMNRIISMTVILFLLGFIIFGGIKRIASFAQIIVPFMALGYILMALIIVFINFSEIPHVVSIIINDAFTAQAGFGAAIGWGVKRGVYSNEAGQGTGPHAASAAEVEHPAQQGLVQAFSVYVDTLFVCSATAFMILMTGQYNIQDNADKHPERFNFTATNAPSWIEIAQDTGQIKLAESYNYATVTSQADQKVNFTISANGEAITQVQLMNDYIANNKEIAPALQFSSLSTHPGEPVKVELTQNMDKTQPLFEPTLFIANHVDVTTEISSPAFTQLAVSSVFGSFGKTFVALAIFFFAFTTILAYYYIAETNAAYLNRFIKTNSTLFIIKIMVMLAAAYGAINGAGYIWNIGDIGVGLMAWLNIVGILILFFMAKPTMKILRDYEAQQKAGVKHYTFDPQKLGIKNATYWEERLKKTQK